MIRLFIVLAAISALSACSRPQPDLKSPCVGAEKSPCDKRAPANQV